MNCVTSAWSTSTVNILLLHWEGVGEFMEWKLCQTIGDETSFDDKQWKVIINRKVEEFGLRKWRRGMEGKETLQIYRTKGVPKKENFYDGGWDSILFFRTRAGSLEVNRRTHRFNEERSKLCQYCKLGGYELDETITHIITECPAYEAAMDWAVKVHLHGPTGSYWQ